MTQSISANVIFSIDMRCVLSTISFNTRLSPTMPVYSCVSFHHRIVFFCDPNELILRLHSWNCQNIGIICPLLTMFCLWLGACVAFYLFLLRIISNMTLTPTWHILFGNRCNLDVNEMVYLHGDTLASLLQLLEI